jgi:preprotein translocase subunit SecD
MKTLYLFLTCVLFLTLSSSAQKSSENLKTVILQTTESRVTPQLLSQSANTISNRLKIYGLKTVAVSSVPEKGQIKVLIPGNISTPEIEGLLTSVGGLGFYETITLNEIGNILKSRSASGQLTNDQRTSSSDARVGCAAEVNKKMTDSIENYLKSIKLQGNYKLFWGVKNKNSMVCLYVLRTDNSGKALLTGSDVEAIKSVKDNGSQSFNIEIRFKPAAVSIWAAATKNNLGKPMAIVIGDKVFYTPVVKDPMTGGSCQIAGDLTRKEADFFLALLNNDPLPLHFILK